MAIHAAPMTLLVIVILGGVLFLGAFQLYQNLNQQQIFGGEPQQGGVLGSSQKCVTGTATSASGVKFANYIVYSDLGSDGLWARIIIKDSKGRTYDTHVVNQGSSYHSSTTGLTISIYKVSALQDGTIVGVLLYVGTTCKIPTTTTTTTTSSIQYKVCTYVNPNNINGSFYLNGQQVFDGQVININPNVAYSIAANIPSGYLFNTWTYARSVNVSNPSLANSTVVFGTSGWDGTCVGNLGINYNQISSTTTTTTTQTCTISTPSCEWGIQYSAAGSIDGVISKGSKLQVIYKPASTKYFDAGGKLISPNDYFELGYIGYNTAQFATITSMPLNGLTVYNGSSIVFSGLNGLQISSDVANSLKMDSIQKTRFYFLYDKISASGDNYPLVIGYWDDANSRIQFYKVFNLKNGSPGLTMTVTFAGQDSPYYVAYALSLGNPISAVSIGSSYANVTGGVQGIYELKSNWTTITPPALKLGDFAMQSDARDNQVVTESTIYNAGTSPNDVVDDSGVIVRNPNQNGATDTFVVSVPNTLLRAVVYFGHQIGLWQWRNNVPLSGTLSLVFPNSGLIMPEDLSDLHRGTFVWRGNNYAYHEQVNMGAAWMRHDYGTVGIQGMEKMQVRPGDVLYEYVFDQDVPFNGTLVNPNYVSPVTINMMGKQFIIIGASSGQLEVLQGTIGTATATTGVSNGVYTIYSDIGSNGQWARIVIKNSVGNTIDTRTINQGDSYDSNAACLTVKIISVSALQDGTVLGTSLAFGPIGSVVKIYSSSADTTSTANTCFPGS